MKAVWIGISAVVALGLTTAAAFAMPLAFTDRLDFGLYLGTEKVSGISQQDIPGVLQEYEAKILQQPLVVTLNGQQAEYTLADLGVSLNHEETTQRLWQESGKLSTRLRRTLTPALTINAQTARERLHADFAAGLDLPTNASLRVGSGNLATVTSSAPGQQINLTVLTQDLERLLQHGTPSTAPIALSVISDEAPIQDQETTQAKQLTEQLLTGGLQLQFEDQVFDVKPFTIRRLVTFVEQQDPQDPRNTILGVQFDDVQLQEYLRNTLEPEINQEAVNARFAMEDDRVEQFALPQRGQALNAEQSANAINQALTAWQTQAPLVVEVTEPSVKEAADIQALGITKRIATGESDFVGSPRNRVHNISVGAAKYHGLLIGPGEEFSFNEHLGPVDASGGFKPELVIKQNVTVPEYGGGLCQVSSTVFRAAVNGGMKITERRNHSYAVSYYGTPGFDATIYPGYTDFRFLNNTPGYLLIQTRIEGTKLYFDFWGTDDGRSVEITGPNPYDRKPDGAVKATLKQVVTLDGEAIIDDSFYSNYKSPKLFPKATEENGEPTTPTPTNT